MPETVKPYWLGTVHLNRHNLADLRWRMLQVVDSVAALENVTAWLKSHSSGLTDSLAALDSCMKGGEAA